MSSDWDRPHQVNTDWAPSWAFAPTNGTSESMEEPNSLFEVPPLPPAPAGINPAHRFIEAKRSLALELYHWTSLCPEHDRLSRTKPAFGGVNDTSCHFAYTLEETERAITAQAMACDRRFRAMNITAANQHPPNELCQEGRPPVRTTQFEYACGTYRRPPQADGHGDAAGDNAQQDTNFNIDIDVFLRQMDGYALPDDAYGTTGDVLRLAHEVRQQHKTALAMTIAIINEMRDKRAFGPMGIVCSEEDARSRIDTLMNTMYVDNSKARIKHRLEARWIALRCARSSWNLLTNRVSRHIQKRVERNDQFLSDMDDDIVEVVSRFMDTVSDANALMLTCKRFSQSKELMLKLPNLRIRRILGSFPHYREVSRDRATLLRGVKKQEVREFVVNRRVIHLLVDFSITQRRKVPLKKKERKDGLSNIERDLSDDEYEDPPDAREKRAPARRQNPHIPPTLSAVHNQDHVYNRFERSENQRRERWERLEGPGEPIDRYTVQHRIPYSAYFVDPLVCSVELVYADTHEPVPSPDYKGGIVPSNTLSRDNLTFRQPRHAYFSNLPAQAKFHIQELSAAHDNRLFKLKVTGRGRLNAAHGGGEKELVVFTAPFEVNSRESVVKAGRQRRTAEEVAQQRAETIKRAKVATAIAPA